MKSNERALMVVWLLLTLPIVVMAVAGSNESLRMYYSNVMQTLSSLACGVICLQVMRELPSGSPLKMAWGLIGASALVWGFGATLFAVYPLLNAGEETPYPYYSDLGYLLTAPLITIAFLYFRKGIGLSTPDWGKYTAGTVLVIGLYWTWLANRDGLSEDSLAMKLTSLGYILTDPVMMATTVLVASSFRGGSVARAWWLVAAGVLLYFVANQLYTYLSMSETYASGHLIDAGWILGFGLIALAALVTRNMMQVND